MARIVARNATIGIDDSAATCRALTGRANTATLTWTAEAPEVTSFTEVNRSRVPDGLQDFELTADVFYDEASNLTDAVLSGILGASTRFVFGPSGSATGLVKYSGCAILTEYTMTMGVADAAQASFSLVARSGSLTRGTF